VLLALGCCAHREPVARDNPDSTAVLQSVPPPMASIPATATSVDASKGGVHALATQQPSPARGMAVDAANVYWANTIGGTVMSVPVGGGAPVTIASKQDHPHAVAVDTSNVYWATDISIMKAPLAGGAASVVTMEHEPEALAVDERDVYAVAPFTIVGVAITGGPPRTIAFNPGNPTALALQGGSIFWTDDQNKRVMAMKLGSHHSTELASGAQGYRNLAVDEAYAYWTDTDAGMVSKVALDGGKPVTLASGQDGPAAIAVDRGQVYWTTRTAVMQLSLHGGTPRSLATDGHPVSIALNASSVYWLDEGDRFKNYANGRVMKAAK
jgi:hypothetical protein